MQVPVRWGIASAQSHVANKAVKRMQEDVDRSDVLWLFVVYMLPHYFIEGSILWCATQGKDRQNVKSDRNLSVPVVPLVAIFTFTGGHEVLQSSQTLGKICRTFKREKVDIPFVGRP